MKFGSPHFFLTYKKWPNCLWTTIVTWGWYITNYQPKSMVPWYGRCNKSSPPRSSVPWGFPGMMSLPPPSPRRLIYRWYPIWCHPIHGVVMLELSWMFRLPEVLGLSVFVAKRRLKSLIHRNVFLTINHTGIVQTKNGLPTKVGKSCHLSHWS